MQNRYVNLALFIIFPLFAAFIIFISTPWGIGVSPDSANYIISASKINSSGSFNSLPSHWPPLYIITLSFFSNFSSDILASTRALHSILFAINSLLFTLIVYKHTKKIEALVISGVFFTLNPHIYSIHFMAWSESLFLSLILLSLYCLNIQKQSSIFFVAFLIGLAAITRYAGLAFSGTFTLVYFLHLLYTKQNSPFAKSCMVGLISITPFLIWISLNLLIRNESTNRELIFHPISSDFFVHYFDLYRNWFGLALFGNKVSTILLVLSLSLASMLFFKLDKRDNLKFLIYLIFSYIIFYTLFIILSISLLDAYIPVDQRIFIYVNIFIFTIVFLITFKNKARTPTSLLLSGVMIALIAQGAWQTKHLIQKNTLTGSGYLSKGLNNLPLLDFAKTTDLKIYSNANKFIELHTGRSSELLPQLYSPNTQLANKDFLTSISKVRAEVISGEAVIILFKPFLWRTYLPNEHMLELQFEFKKFNSFPSGKVYLQDK